MNATFYNYTGNPKKILKNLSSGYVYTGLKLYNEFSEQNPELIIEFNSNVYNCNYAVIDGKYYFITDRVLDNGNRMILTLHKDVLTDIMTNANQSVVNLPVIIERSTNYFNSYIADNMQSSQVNYTTYSIAFDTDFSLTGNIIVCAIGGE